MAFLSTSQPADNHVISLPAGTSTGHILLTRNGVVIQGAGMDETTWLGDNTIAFMATVSVDPAPPGGLPITSLYVRDLTIDAGDFVAHVAMLGSASGTGPVLLDCRRVRFTGYHQGAFAILKVGGSIVLEDCWFEGDGIAVQLATEDLDDVTISNVRVIGGKGGFVGANTISCGDMLAVDFQCRPWYWAIPFGETVTPTAFAAGYMDVSAHEEGDRAQYDTIQLLTPIATWTIGDPLPNVGRWNRIEADSGEWTQVLQNGGIDKWRKEDHWNPAAAAPTGPATIYRVTLARIQPAGWTATRLTHYGWRDVEGYLAATPALVEGMKARILRASTSGTRDVDIGAVHVFDGASVWRDVVIEGGWSDQFTFSSGGHKVRNLRAALGQDMGITDDSASGSNEFDGVVVERHGANGIYVDDNARPRIRSSVTRRNGFATTESGAGFGLDAPAAAISGIDRWLASPVRSVHGPRRSAGVWRWLVAHDNRTSDVRYR